MDSDKTRKGDPAKFQRQGPKEEAEQREAQGRRLTAPGWEDCVCTHTHACLYTQGLAPTHMCTGLLSLARVLLGAPARPQVGLSCQRRALFSRPDVLLPRGLNARPRSALSLRSQAPTQDRLSGEGSCRSGRSLASGAQVSVDELRFRHLLAVRLGTNYLNSLSPLSPEKRCGLARILTSTGIKRCLTSSNKWTVNTSESRISKRGLGLHRPGVRGPMTKCGAGIQASPQGWWPLFP